MKRTGNEGGQVEFFRHDLREEDIECARQVMRSVMLTTGPRVEEFEEKFARYLNAAHAVGTTSCTGALHLALLRHGVGPGDEVITTPMTFAATATAVLQAGADPVFADVHPRSALLEVEAVEAALTPRTKAVIPVHLYGRMVDMRAFSRLSEKHGVAVIEDAAHCLEGMREGVRPGTLGNAACFSFYATKGMTSGEGGAVVCRDGEDAAWYRAARHHGISRSASVRYGKKYEPWDMEMMGWKYNMDDIQAALLLHQVDRLEANRARREHLERLYRDLLGAVGGLEFVEAPGEGERSGHHLFTVLLPRGVERNSVVQRLQEGGIGCSVNYQAVHTLTYFRRRYGYRPEDFPVAHDIGQRTVSLPLYPSLREDEVERVSSVLKAVLGER
jgi:dTDP-4-amino-4,6-dideoxygalactose transaminase